MSKTVHSALSKTEQNQFHIKTGARKDQRGAADLEIRKTEQESEGLHKDCTVNASKAVCVHTSFFVVLVLFFKTSIFGAKKTLKLSDYFAIN